MKHSFFQKVQISVIEAMAKVHWDQTTRLSDENLEEVRQRLTRDYYIILTRKNNQLTTFFIGLANFALFKKWGFYSHALMNLEDEVKSDSDFRLIEATGVGVHYSTFESVFNSTSNVALLLPKNVSPEEWTAALDRAKVYLGRPYDNLFDLKNSLEINCVELVRLALQELPDYSSKFAEFEKMVAKYDKITPDMFLACSDFEVVFKA